MQTWMVSNSSQDFVASGGLGDYQKFLALARDLGREQKIHARRWKGQ